MPAEGGEGVTVDWLGLPQTAWRSAALQLPWLTSLQALRHVHPACRAALSPWGPLVQEWRQLQYSREVQLQEWSIPAPHDSAMDLGVSADGRLAVVGGGNDFTLCVRDLVSRQATSILEGHTSVVLSVAVTPDGNTAASGGSDETVRVWDLRCGTCTAVLAGGHTSGITGLDVTPDGTRAVSGDYDGTMTIWDVKTQLAVGALSQCQGGARRNVVWDVVLREDGGWAVTGSADGRLRVWDLDQMQCVAALEAPDPVVRADGQTPGREVSCVAATPDLRVIAAGSYDGTVRMWEVAGKLRAGQQPAHTRTLHVSSAEYLVGVLGLDMSLDGSRVVAGGYDSKLSVFDDKGGQAVCGELGSWLRCVGITAGGRYAVCGARDGALSVWDLDQHLV